MGFFLGKLLCQVIIILLLKDLLGMRPHLVNTTVCPILLLERRYLQIANYIHNQLSYTCREAPKFVFFHLDMLGLLIVVWRQELRNLYTLNQKVQSIKFRLDCVSFL
ncbi:hypothetical protein WN943_014583 [Citrus x changshan-huyou]